MRNLPHPWRRKKQLSARVWEWGWGNCYIAVWENPTSGAYEVECTGLPGEECSKISLTFKEAMEEAIVFAENCIIRVVHEE